MEEVFYTREHYWIIIENDIAIIGFTNHIIDSLENITCIEMSNIGTICNKTDVLGTLYADNEEFDIYSICTGEIVEINELLTEEAENIRTPSKDCNWIYKILINNKIELEEDLISEEEYNEYIEDL